MNIHQYKRAIYWIEGLNALAATFYASFIYFVFATDFGFTNKQNLLLGAAHGGTFALCSWYGGSLAERRGKRRILLEATGMLVLALGCAWMVRESMIGQYVCFLLWTVAVSTTWPVLESLISRGEQGQVLGRRIGRYNLVWSGMAAFAYFCGGWLIGTFGTAAILVIPMILHIGQGCLLWKLPETWTKGEEQQDSDEQNLEPVVEFPHRPIARSRLFVRLALVANPFAYIGINCLIPIIPFLAQKLGLNAVWAGVACSVWLFARMGTFYVLSRWHGWHYRFSLFAAAMGVLVISYLGVRLSPTVGLLIGFQVIFGISVGLIYYSSLFYSMDLGEGGSDHGGVHEAAIGMGVCVGPALAAAALHLAPDYPDAGVWAAGLLLVLGFGLVLGMKRWGR